jgi:hypothetical protein
VTNLTAHSPAGQPEDHGLEPYSDMAFLRIQLIETTHIPRPSRLARLVVRLRGIFAIRRSDSAKQLP